MMFELRIRNERRFYDALARLDAERSDVRESPEGWQPHVS